MKKRINKLRNIYKKNPFINILYKPINFLSIKYYERTRYRRTLSYYDDLMQKYYLKTRGILHVGANRGQEYYSYRRNKISNIIFFEPLPQTFKVLKKKLKSKAILVNVALGNDNTKINMNLSKGNEGRSSSILKPKLHLKYYPHIKFEDMVEVKMIKLDDFSKLHPDLKIEENYNFLTLDVQGYELEVLKGAKNILRNIDYIYTEVNRVELYEGCAIIEELDDFLKDFKIERIETKWTNKQWGDAFYTKKS